MYATIFSKLAHENGIQKISKRLNLFQQREVDSETEYPSREEYTEDLASRIKLSVQEALIKSVPPYVMENLKSHDQDVGEVDVDHYYNYSEIVFRIPPIINKPFEYMTLEYDDEGYERYQPKIESELDRIYVANAYPEIVNSFWNVLDNEKSPYTIKRANGIGEHDSTPLTGFYYILEVY